MGGFLLKTADWCAFPVDAKQVLYLVDKGYISAADVIIEDSILADKNKSDGMVRFITVCQILWFLISCLGRAVQHLAMTTLELTTLGFILCSVGTFVCWAGKPQDVTVAIVIESNTHLSDILTRAGEAAKHPYKFTPLDFVGRDSSSWMLYWMYYFNILRKMRLVFPSKKRPLDKIPDGLFRDLTVPTRVLLFTVQIAYGAVHIAGWNFHFPTSIERTLWHFATIAMISSLTSAWIMDVMVWQGMSLFRLAWSKLRRHGAKSMLVQNDIEKAESYSGKRKTRGLHRLAARLRNNSPQCDPSMELPLKVIFPITAIGATYVIARAYILVADMISLRSVSPSAFETVNWMQFWPWNLS
jgi:hypothetical protein